MSDWKINAYEISGLRTPIYDTEAANKKYVDDNAGGGTDVAWSGASEYYGHSGNSDIHFPSSNMESWFGTLYYPSSLGNEVHTWMDNSGSNYSQAYASAQISIYSETYSSEGDLTNVLDDNYAPSGDISWAYFSSLADVDVSNPVEGSGLKWNGSHWVVSSVTGGEGGASNLSDLTIDDNKDWNSKGIHNLLYVSSSTISGGTIITSTPTNDYHTATKKYVDDSIEGAGGYTDEQAQDAVGDNVGIGLSYDDGSAAISVDGYSTISSNALSGQEAKELLDSSGSSWSKAYMSAQIAVYTDTDTHPGSGQLTATSPITISEANAYIIGATADLGIAADSITQTMLKSGSEYWKGYQSGQIALYSETYGDEASLTAVLDDNYAPSSGYNTHINDNSKHYTSGSAKNWFDSLYAISGDYLTEAEADALYAPTGTSESTGSGALTLSSGLTSDATVYHVGTTTQVYLDDIPQNTLKSGSEYWKAYESGQIALYSETYTGTVDTANSPVDNDFAKFTDSNTIEGRSYSEVRSDLNVADGADVTGDNETYSSESDLTTVLDDNYAPSGDISWATSSGMTDVSSTTPTSGAMRVYDGSEWKPISGCKTVLFDSKPAAAENYKGQIIRASGSTDEKTWIYISVKNDANSWEWVMLGYST